ncbi:hypothetical protein DFS33DRAFT_1384763 [Desarmillaria ectypa]|nr:hypothetical protein DFS33DRAFT_1384763 [Desarmillaria ectypa]
MDDEHAQISVEKLEVEEEDARIKRIGALASLHREILSDIRVEAVMHKLNSTASDPRPVATAAKPFHFGEKTFAMEPPSELLSRVQAFLPEIEASNAILTQRVELDPKSVDIEHITEGMDQYIEMNLGLGVFEHRKDAQSQQQNLDFQMGVSSASESDEEDSSDTDSDSSSEIITSFLPSPRLIKPLPKRGLLGNKGPRIVVLGSQEFPESSSTR